MSNAAIISEVTDVGADDENVLDRENGSVRKAEPPLMKITYTLRARRMQRPVMAHFFLSLQFCGLRLVIRASPCHHVRVERLRVEY